MDKMAERIPVVVTNAREEVKKMLRQLKLDKELETMDFIEIRNRFFAAFELLGKCLINKAPGRGQ